jgi:imidazolonepropionase
MKTLDRRHPVDVVSTFLGAHALPEEYKGKTDAFIDYMMDTVLPEVAHLNLAEFCDVFCEKHVFSIQQSKRLLMNAKKNWRLKSELFRQIICFGLPRKACEPWPKRVWWQRCCRERHFV